MKLLLDTHLLLWWLSNDPALPQSAAALMREERNTLFVSAVTYWEIYLKKGLGKLKIPRDFIKYAAAEGVEDLPLKAAHGRVVADLPWHHRDPFDRVLIAQARSEGFRLLTADRQLGVYGRDVLVAD